MAYGLLLPPVSKSLIWRATVTPLASIIGSGFLVLGPILSREYGQYAPLVMLALCAVAYGFGSAIRFNISHFESLPEGQANGIRTLEAISSWALALAYIVSVTYYLNLLGSFAVSLTNANERVFARLVTTAVLIFIGVFGLRHGLKRLEDLEETAVTIKLAIIAGLLIGMVVYLGHLLNTSGTVHNPAQPFGSASLFLVFGLVICVQGFETSRYLGKQYDAPTRIRTMKLAQWIATGIYLVYAALMAFSFDASTMGTSETAIIDVTHVVAPVLPAMLVAAALAAQFSAAVADTAGCGGLISELSRNRVPQSIGYIVVTIGGVLLTWTADVFEIIAYASRAFAIYYSMQSIVAARLAASHQSAWAFLYGILAILGIVIAIFGIPAG
ncbi:hypothetical protein CGZ80_08930 [Rhodopirellula sp. MGV]|nr:hypothetical protein CGZ80_08930 [Rhodopirellula sp. MGV]PNY36886.1 hypothetical protein C2E31_10835 [Rhodopirellula baltica]